MWMVSIGDPMLSPWLHRVKISCLFSVNKAKTVPRSVARFEPEVYPQRCNSR